jgi:hypothetical protein
MKRLIVFYILSFIFLSAFSSAINADFNMYCRGDTCSGSTVCSYKQVDGSWSEASNLCVPAFRGPPEPYNSYTPGQSIQSGSNFYLSGPCFPAGYDIRLQTIAAEFNGQNYGNISGATQQNGWYLGSGAVNCGSGSFNIGPFTAPSTAGNYQIEFAVTARSGFSRGPYRYGGSFGLNVFSLDSPGNNPINLVNDNNICSALNQTIFSLYQSNNSHVALWNNESYEYKICYDQIFGKVYSGLNPRVCNGKNTVLNITGISNAHAEKPNGVNYPIGVCYGEMSCSVRTGNCNPGGEKVVARLSGETNAHVSNSSFSLYNKLLCCSERPLGFNNLSWKDFGESKYISSAKNGDSVVLYAVTNFTAGTRVIFEIFEDDVLFRNDIRTGSNNLSGIVDANGIAKASWTITQTDIDAGDGFGEGEYLEFYYIANVDGLYNRTSNELTTNKNSVIVLPGSCNIDIVSGIDKLNHRGIYFTNKSIEFNQSRVSQNVNVEWIIQGDNENEIRRNEKSFVMNFSRPGQKTITLKTGSVVGCGEQSKQIAILVAGEKEMLAFINAPFYNQVFKFNSNLAQVFYSANDSYVIGVSPSSCSRSILCWAGNCPTKTSGTPENCPTGEIIVNNFLTVDNRFNTINFNWSRINKNGEVSLKSGKGEANASGTTSYSKNNDKSNAIGDKAIKVIVNSSIVGFEIEKMFIRNFTVGTCINGGRQRVNIDNSSGRIINVSNTLSDKNACNDRMDGEGSCCPISYSCDRGLCQDTGSSITSCGGYFDFDSCSNDPYGASEFEYNNKVQRGLPSECNVNYRCEWRQNACVFNITQMDNLGNFGGSCLETAVDVDANACNNGESTKLISITSTSTGELSCLTCQSGIYEVPCGRPSVELPFFGTWQLLVSLLGIIGAYLFIRRK